MKKILIMVFFSILFGCSKDFEPPLDDLENEQIAKTKSASDFKESRFGSPMVLGEKVENPYSITSLRKASEKMRSGSTSDIVSTHYYVRFLPKDNHEYTLLLKNVLFFPFPLDRKIVEGGSFYRDPDPANEGKQFSWQYSIVPVQQALPDVQYEILDELRMPENTEMAPREMNYDSGAVFEQKSAAGGRGDNGTTDPGPSGPPQSNKVVVRVWDNVINQYIPLQGLAVNVINTALGQCLTYGVTDATGTAIMNRYYTVTKDIYYNIFWSDGKESKWFMTDVNNNQLFYNVKALVGITYIDIKSSSTNVVNEQQLGTIHRAAYRTYYKTNSNLLRPNHEDATQIGFRDEYSPDYAGKFCGYDYERASVYIEIMGRDAWGQPNSTFDIFGAMVHELAHLNHSLYSAYTRSDRMISESWARVVEKYLTVFEYSPYDYKLFRIRSLPYIWGPPGPLGQPTMKDFIIPNNLNCQKWPFIIDYNTTTPGYKKMLAYSPIFIDLIDDENQKDYYHGVAINNNWQNVNDRMYKEYPDDQVKNFTIGELQNLLKTTKTLEDLQIGVKRLSNLHGNSTSAIDNLFKKYIEHWQKYNSASGAPGCIPQGSGGCVIYD